MLSVEELKRIIITQREEMDEFLNRERLIEREVDEKRLLKFLQYPNILAILGVRRSGKSVLSWLLMRGKRFGYINFFDERLLGFSPEDFEKLVQAFHELYGDLDYFVFDEIQSVQGWERFLSRVRTSKRVIITGSSSNLLSGELSTVLTGRYVSFELYPFSFKEFLEFRGIKLEKNWMYSTKETAKVKKALEEYIKVGGFPEALKFGRIYLQTIYRDIVEKDVLFRYKIRDIQALRELAKYLVSNFSKEITYGKLKNLINIKDVHTVKNYVEYLERAYLIFQVRRFSFKLKSQMLSPRKVYAVDTGLINTVSFKFSENIGRLMENLVFLELLRRRSYKFSDDEIYYWKDAKGEVDFVVKNKNKVTQLIQVTYELNKENFEREVASLLKASKELKCKELLLITWDQEDTTKEGVKIMPLWKWLLQP
ncbi:ATP-binding protein [Thermococcus argininiproducens]|uniref:ATP-binding protein n=1 Tax=Thermococcus argininiproducens TaxID=2866384 RepID=A0A9E7M9X3_9EURY|nr:ATP-binding protein [Thermococcus argininiproducens]USH00031.1 ATP-binding protein [Thermococcus argininiproducens]